METVISINIDNLIRGYCSNFLSYLYLTYGWKRTMFEMGKEVFIPSNIEGKENRIVVMNNGTIILTCYSAFDALNCMEFIISQFKYGRMSSYCVLDDEVNIKTKFTVTMSLNDFYYSEKGNLNNQYGNISISNSVATLTSDSYENSCELVNIVRDIYFYPIHMAKFRDKNNKLRKQINDDIDDELNDERLVENIIFSVFLLLAGVKILEYV